jgi:hypothetical protein
MTTSDWKWQVGLRGWTSVPMLLCIVLLTETASVASVPRFRSAVTLRVGANPADIVARDLNRDRNPDLATADFGSGTVSVLLGKGNGDFGKRVRYRTARSPAGLIAEDVNDDGKRDLVSASRDRAGSITVFFNRGSGRFGRGRTIAAGSRASAVAAGDINRDGVVDLVTAHESDRDLGVLLGTGSGRFRVAHRYRGPAAIDVAVGDLNRDGKPDVALVAGGGQGKDSVVVRLGRGDGSFAPAVGLESGADPWSLTLADLNDDDTLDIATADYGDGSASVFLGAGDGTFSARSPYPMGKGRNVDGIVVADFDRDGKLDIATPTGGSPVVRRGRGDGTFLSEHTVRRHAGATLGGAAADFNRDGWPDLAFSADCFCDYGTVPSFSAYVFLNRTGRTAPP